MLPLRPDTPRERRAITDFIHRIDGHTDVLDRALTRWADRDDTRADPGVRVAANTAMDAIDAMLRELHTLRGALVTEIRAHDDIALVRADELIERCRQDRAQAAAADITEAAQCLEL